MVEKFLPFDKQNDIKIIEHNFSKIKLILQ